MLGASLDINLEELGITMEELQDKLSDLSPLMERIGALLLLSSQMRIEQTKTSPEGAPWAPLAASTVKKRTKDGSIGGGILRVKGNLLRSLNYRVEGNSTVISMGGSGKSMDYARIQQLGGDINRAPSKQKLYYGATGNRWVTKKKAKRTRIVDVGGYVIHIPARPVLGVSAQDQADIVQEFNDYMAE